MQAARAYLDTPLEDGLCEDHLRRLLDEGGSAEEKLRWFDMYGPAIFDMLRDQSAEEGFDKLKKAVEAAVKKSEEIESDTDALDALYDGVTDALGDA